MRLAGNIAGVGEVKNLYQILVRKFKLENPLERPRRTWEDNMEMDLKEMRCGLNSSGSGWSHFPGRFEYGYEFLDP
jgi:hypothetical protein